ncbi:acyltransferase domain-containing protein [Kitasatospora terrestris]|uniref:Malonyl-CoA:ACP transacylase (MAT) domain-containing protein n=1 Tax=Kitasatospora terrestris TaxID=258051 RepID=A0ABP9DN96_9ACTN
MLPGIGPAPGRVPRLMLWSAADPAEEEALRAGLRRWIKARGDRGFDGVADAWGAPAGGPARGALVAAGATEALAALDGLRPGALRGAAAGPDPVALLLPGQGAQHPRMAHGLYGVEPVFTEAVDEVLGLLGADGPAARADWLSETPRLPLDDVRRTLPLVFAVDWALGRLLHSWGVRPAVLLGQGIGEQAAAALAEVMRLADAVDVVREQADWLARTPEGGMLAVAAGPDTVRRLLTAGVTVAAVNGPDQTLLAGETRQLADSTRALALAGLTAMKVRAGAAYHSPVVASACRRAAEVYRRIDLRAPAVPLYSATTGGPLPAELAADPEFWAGQPSRPVRLESALNALFAAGPHLCVECGPGQGLNALVRRHPRARGGAVSLLSARPRNAEHDRRSALTAAARLWTAGHEIDLTAVHRLG